MISNNLSICRANITEEYRIKSDTKFERVRSIKWYYSSVYQPFYIDDTVYSFQCFCNCCLFQTEFKILSVLTMSFHHGTYIVVSDQYLMIYTNSAFHGNFKLMKSAVNCVCFSLFATWTAYVLISEWTETQTFCWFNLQVNAIIISLP
jgi:hypothetical protein